MSEIVKFEHPVQLADRRLEEVTVRRMTIGDLIDFPFQSNKDLLTEASLTARLCSLKLEELRLVDAYDYGKVQDVMLRFLNGSVEEKADNENNASDA